MSAVLKMRMKGKNFKIIIMAETKKTTKAVAKPAAKTTTKKEVTKPAAKTSNELSVTGNKKVETLMKEFTKKFPYLHLRLYTAEAKNAAAAHNALTPYRIDISKTIASVRDKGAKGGEISIFGNKKIKTLEAEFERVFGLYAQVCYSDSSCAEEHGYYTNGSDDEYTLSAFNEKCEKRGCKKDNWK